MHFWRRWTLSFALAIIFSVISAMIAMYFAFANFPFGYTSPAENLIILFFFILIFAGPIYLSVKLNKEAQRIKLKGILPKAAIFIVALAPLLLWWAVILYNNIRY